MPSDLHQRASLPSELLSLDLLRPFVLEKDEWFRTDSGTSYRLSKSKTSLSSRKANEQLDEYTDATYPCQHSIDDFHKNPQRIAISFHHATMRPRIAFSWVPHPFEFLRVRV
jgi:hypothetical protein